MGLTAVRATDVFHRGSLVAVPAAR